MSLALPHSLRARLRAVTRGHPRLTVEDVIALSQVSGLDTGGAEMTPELQARYDLARSHLTPGRPGPTFQPLHSIGAELARVRGA